MRTYSPFFQTLHDETAPVGNLGRGTHYSVLRSVCWHDINQKPLKQAAYHDIAVVWDEDHDVRVIELLEAIYEVGLLSSIAFIGERKGGANVILVDSTAIALGESALAKLQQKIETIARNLPDPWPADVGTISHPGSIISATPENISLYLKNISMLWNLGSKPIVKTHSEPLESSMPSAAKGFNIPRPFPSPISGPQVFNWDGSEAMTVGELKSQLNGHPENDYITFSGGLAFNRCKRRADNLIDIELSPMAYITTDRKEVLIDELMPVR